MCAAEVVLCTGRQRIDGLEHDLVHYIHARLYLIAGYDVNIFFRGALLARCDVYSTPC